MKSLADHNQDNLFRSFYSISLGLLQLTSRCHDDELLFSAASFCLHSPAEVTAGKHNGRFSLTFALDPTGLALTVKDFRLGNRSMLAQLEGVPARYILVHAMNQLLQHFAVQVPPDLAQYIPCTDRQTGRCQGLRYAADYMEFHSATAAPYDYARSDYFVGESWEMHPRRLSSVFLTSLLLAGSGAAWRGSARDLPCVLVLAVLCLCWWRDGPFAQLPSLVSDLDMVPARPHHTVQDVMWKLDCWSKFAACVTGVEMLVAGLYGVLISVIESCSTRQRVCRKQAYLWLALIVIASQFLLLAGMPMMMRIGHEMGQSLQSAPPRPCFQTLLATLNITSSLSGSADDIRTADVVSCASTVLWVSCLGVYVLVPIFAVPPGMFMGALAFVGKHRVEGVGTHGSSCSSAYATATLCILFTEFAISCATLGPFCVVYQTLSGQMSWWYAYWVLALCRPFLAVHTLWLVARWGAEKSWADWAQGFSMCFAYLAMSLWASALLWDSFAASLTPLRGVRAFAGAMYAAITWFTASTMYFLLKDMALNETRNAHKMGNTLRTCAQQVLRKVGHHCFSEIAQSLCAWKLFEQIPDPESRFLREGAEEVTELAEEGAEQSLSFPKGEHWAAVWLLEMDALASLLYHCFKTVWLAVTTGFIEHEFDALKLLYADQKDWVGLADKATLA